MTDGALEQERRDNNQAVLILLGEIKGELHGIRELVNHNSEATNRRIDDLKDSVEQRLEDHRSHSAEMHATLDKQINKRGSIAGLGGGTLVVASIEMIKALLR